MKKKHVFELWEARVEKLLSLEVKALKEYKRLLGKYSHILGGSRIKYIIRGIMSDEARHIEIAKKLRHIVLTSKNRYSQKEEIPK